MSPVECGELPCQFLQDIWRVYELQWTLTLAHIPAWNVLDTFALSFWFSSLPFTFRFPSTILERMLPMFRPTLAFGFLHPSRGVLFSLPEFLDLLLFGKTMLVANKKFRLSLPEFLELLLFASGPF